MISTTDRNNLCHVFAWDIYGRLIMHVENATLAEVLSFCTRIAYGDVPEEKIMQLRNNLKKASVTSYKYDNGNLCCITNPRGIDTYFDYDGFGRLIEEKVTTQPFGIGTRFQGRAIKFSSPLKTFAQKSYFVVPCLK